MVNRVRTIMLVRLVGFLGDNRAIRVNRAIRISRLLGLVGLLGLIGL